MSAVNSSSGDREVEALRRAQRAHEPSMEEILASIRSMIVEEREEEKSATVRPASSRTLSSAPQIVYSKDPAPQRATQEAVSRAEAPRHPETKPSPGIKSAAGHGGPDEVERSSEASARTVVESRSALPDLPNNALPDDEPLLSLEAGQTVTSAFEALSANLAAQGVEMARGMAREMLRPMLKIWLDENLPGIVERLVRAEIERVARGFR